MQEHPLFMAGQNDGNHFIMDTDGASSTDPKGNSLPANTMRFGEYGAFSFWNTSSNKQIAEINSSGMSITGNLNVSNGIDISGGTFSLNTNQPISLGSSIFNQHIAGANNVSRSNTFGMDVVFAGHSITLSHHVIGIVLNQHGLKPSLSFGTEYVNSEVSSGNVLLVFFSGINVKITANGNSGGAVTVFWIQSDN